MLLQESRRDARVSSSGDLVLLEAQDRSLWNVAYIREGISLVDQALASRRFGPYALQGAIAAVHAPLGVHIDDGLGPDRSALHLAAVGIALTGGRAEQSGRCGHARRARRWPRPHGRYHGARHLDGYLPAHPGRAELCRQEPERRFLQARLNGLVSA
jgi:hypothetical protein